MKKCSRNVAKHTYFMGVCDFCYGCVTIIRSSFLRGRSKNSLRIENMSTPSFNLPQIHDNEDGAWGPSPSHLPPQFKDIPYAPYSKSDKLGRFADWNDTEATARATAPISGGGTTRGGTRRGREQVAFGSGAASAFAYFHVEDEASFSLVDNKTTAPRRGGATSFNRGRGARTMVTNAAKPGQRSSRGGYSQGNKGTGVMRGGRRGWRDWEKVAFFMDSITLRGLTKL